MSKLVAFDVGASSLKAVLYDRERGIVASEEAAYGPVIAPHRHNADVWWSAARAAVRTLGTEDIEAIVMSGTMENLIIRDGEGMPLHSVVLFSNPCGTSYFEAMGNEIDEARHIIGNVPEPLMTGFKWCWFCDIAPTIVPRVRMVMAGAKDDLLYRMTGRAVTDAVTASTTGYMDMARRDWSGDMLGLFNLKRDMLPEILEPGALVGALKPEAASHLGLRSGIPVMNGCGDVGASTIGSFCDRPGDISLHLGASGWVSRTVPAVDLSHDSPFYRLAHPWRDLMIEISPLQSAGLAMTWAEKTLGLTLEAAEAQLAIADASPPNLVFLPYLAGERAPFLDDKVRGAFIGLDGSHTPGDLLYAVLEGIGFSVRANLAAMGADGIGQVTMIGDGAKSPVWRQMLADIMGFPINLVSNPTLTTAIGVCRIATAVLGWPAPENFERTQVWPRPERLDRIERLDDAFRRATDIARAFSHFLAN